MKELIAVGATEIQGKQIQTVNARDLHSFLESKRDFSNWVNDRINKYGFAQGVDFIKYNNFVESDSKARIEYHLTLDMAKELSMVERNEKGNDFIVLHQTVKNLDGGRPAQEYHLTLDMAQDQDKKRDPRIYYQWVFYLLWPITF